MIRCRFQYYTRIYMKKTLRADPQKQHIEEIFAGSQYNRFGRISANVLGRDIDTAFAGDNKFIYELLQNADDAADETTEPTVRFEVIVSGGKQYLLFSHNGCHFNREDVSRITDYAAQGENTKAQSDPTSKKQKIGYKGVGFKSVFTVADSVTIFSGGYQFRFDPKSRQLLQWPEDKPYPWQLVPVWTEVDQLPKELQPIMQNGQVNFLFALPAGVNIENALEFIISNTQMLLFLKHINTISISHANNKIDRLTINKNGINYEICKNNNKVSSWLVFNSQQIKISENISKQLALMSDHACPERLKKASHTTISFAIKLINGAVSPLLNAKLYCYLPTQVEIDLPFIVNADFLLEPARAHLASNVWNDYLFELIARTSLGTLAELAKLPGYRMDVLPLFCNPKLPAIPQTCRAAFKQAFKEALASTGFIPNRDLTSLLTVRQATVDQTSFYRLFPEIKYVNETHALTHPELVDLAQFCQRASVSVIGWQTLLKELPSMVLQYRTVDFNIRLITFLYQHRDQIKTQELSRSLLFLTQKNQLVAASGLYFQPETALTYFSQSDQLSFLHPQVQSATEQGIKKWLVKLGVKKPKKLTLLRGHVFQMIEQDKLTEKTIVSYTQFVFSLEKDGLLTPTDYHKLRQLKVLSHDDKTLLLPWQAYLPDALTPITSIENELPNRSILISSAYYADFLMREDSAKELQLWGKFFEKIGVNSDISFVSKDVQVTTADQYIWNFQAYLKYLQNNGQATSQVYSNQEIYNLVYSPMMSLIQYSSLLPIFFGRMTAQWNIIASNRSMSYQMSRTQNEIHCSYVQFIVQTNDCLIGHDQRYFPASGLYAPQFAGLAQFDNTMVIAHVDNDIDDEQLRYYGVHFQLCFTNCFNILSRLSNAGDEGIKYFAVIWRQLLTIHNQITSYEKNRLQQVAMQFPNQNGELCQRSALRVFGLNEPTPIESRWLKRFPGFSIEDMRQLGMLFNIESIVDKPRQLYFGNSQSTRPEQDTLTLFLSQLMSDSEWTYLGIVAHFESRQRATNAMETWHKLCDAIMQLQFYNVEELGYYFDDADKTVTFVHAYRDGTNFYYRRQWNNGLRRADFLKLLCEYLNLAEQTQKLLNILLSLTNDEDKNECLQKFTLPMVPTFNQALPDNNVGELEHGSSEQDQEPDSPRITLLKRVDLNIAQGDQVSSDESYHTEESSSEDSYELTTPPSTTTAGRKSPPTTPMSSNAKESSVNNTALTLINPHAFDFTKLDKIPKAAFTVAKTSNVKTKKRVVDTKFVPKKTTSNIDNVTHKKDPKTGTPKLSPRFLGKKNPKQHVRIDKDEIGRCGEELVYLQLRHHYQAKYPTYKLVEGEAGFKMVPPDNAPHKCITVIWHLLQNKQEDRDITVIKPPNKNDEAKTQERVRRFIEVKATITDKNSFSWTKNEMALAKEAGHRYKIIHIRKLTSTPVFQQFKDPYPKLENALHVESYKLSF